MTSLGSSLFQFLGLALDIVGVILIFFFGVPSMSKGSYQQFIVTGHIDEAERKKEENYDRLGKLGLGLVCVGFIFQLIPSAFALFTALQAG